MPRDTDVLCAHCNTYMPRRREREHRQLVNSPFDSPPPPLISKLRPVVNADSDDEYMGSDAAPTASFEDFGDAMDLVQDGPEDVFETHWRLSHRATVESDDEDEYEDEMDVDEEGANDEGEWDDQYIDWDALKAESGLSAWDRLGEGFENEAATIANRLAEYDLAICRAFAYKVETHTTDTSFKKLPYAFPQNPPLPSLHSIRARAAFLSGFKPQVYDCCPNSCCCYAPPHLRDLTHCPTCKEPRYRADGKARKTFTYIPVKPRLAAFSRNADMAMKMQYRGDCEYAPDVISDVFDGTNYHTLRQRGFFTDKRDVALGLSTDGFAPFKRRKSTAWPLIVFNYNLHPDIRIHLDNILALGIVPGPKKPHDMDSFLWPFVQEMRELGDGIRAFDILSGRLFVLRAYLILVFGDIPAVSMLMCMKGHNGFSPCRMCEITGLRVPEAGGTTLYVPLYRTNHPDVKQNDVQSYDPHRLPLRTQDGLLSQAREVQAAITITAADELARKYGIKSVPLLSHLPTIFFPASFPYDFMHLIWENLVKNLVLHWTGEFKKLDDGNEDYELEKAVWQGLGARTARSGSTIPSVYGARVPNVATNGGGYISAEMWSFWTLYLGPILLRRCFKHEKYFKHFVRLIELLSICLQFEITTAEVDEIEHGFIRWVREYEDIYYQHDPMRISACPVTIHALLHIASSIRAAGPVWAYWAFSMERYCGALQPAIRSRRFPYASLDRHVTEVAQLTQIKTIYNAQAALSLKPVRGAIAGLLSDPSYPTCVLLPPHIRAAPAAKFVVGIANALATRFSVTVAVAKAFLKNARVEQWGKVRRVDSSEGDTMRASEMGSTRDDSRDASHVRYEMLIDLNARLKHRKPNLIQQTFYGQLQHIFAIHPGARRVSAAVDDLAKTTIIMAAVRNHVVDASYPPPGKLDIHYSSRVGTLDFTDVASIQCLVARVKDRETPCRWAIFDRSGSLARAIYEGEDEELEG